MEEGSAGKKEVVRAILKGSSLGIVLGLIFAAGFFVRGWSDQSRPTTTSYGLLNEIEGLLDSYYLYDMPSDEKLVQGAAVGFVAAVNEPHTFYTEPESAEMSSNDLAGEFGGIGAEVTITEGGQTIISRVYEDSPAFKVGLLKGDIILIVDEVDVADGSFDLDGVVSLIRGAVGTQVDLLILRGVERLTFTITRERVEVPSVVWAMSEESDRIGVIAIIQFTARTKDEVGAAIDDLRGQGAEGFVLDVRNNGGGLLDAAVDVAGHFMSGKTVLYEIEHDGVEQTYRAGLGGMALNIPLVVLVNGGSASASEILAGALQDNGRAQLIGDQTYGKGTVQVIFDLSDGSTLRITNAEWFTPDHHKIEGVGLTPDIAVSLGANTDEQLSVAINALLEMLD